MRIFLDLISMKIVENYSTLLFCLDRKSTRLNSSHLVISYAVFCLKKQVVILIFAGLGYLLWKCQLSGATSSYVNNLLVINRAEIHEGIILEFANEQENLEQETLQQ